MRSMTGFAEVTGGDETLNWRWEMRGVNGRGFDLRLRMPDGFESLEPAVRKSAGASVKRGNVTLNLRILSREGTRGPDISEEALDAAVGAMKRVEEAMRAHALDYQPLSADRVLSFATQLGNGPAEEILPDSRRTAMISEVATLVDVFDGARQGEGRALSGIISGQVDAIAELVEQAATTAEARDARAGQVLREKLSVVLETTEIVDEARLAQELAQLAVKADVTEELDRLRTHVEAARALLVAPGPVGRKFDFLAQEFNREANTLCSKSGSSALTAIGLDLKVIIDQMREQIQNVE